MSDPMSRKETRRKFRILAQWENACIVCGREFASLACVTVEHIKSRHKGGSGDPENLAPAHYTCNQVKRASSLIAGARRVEKEFLRLTQRQGTANALAWLNRNIPKRYVPPAALLPPLEAARFFGART